MSGTGNTTAPADPEAHSTRGPGDETVPAFVLCHCVPQPERVGQVTLFDPASAVHWIIGREVQGGDPRAHFFEQRAGVMTDRGALEGLGISHEQLRVAIEGDALRVWNVGKAAVFVDRCEVPRGHSVLVGPGAVIEIFGHSVFVVERRPRSIPAPHRLLLPLQRFGERCAMGFDGESPAAWEQREDAAYAANAPGHVLILGETGTGKDVTANAIHAKSHRARGPFKAINCAELTSELTAARFFGIRKGYPNPGSPETNGYFGDAAGGDLLLDEIACLDKSLQATLLRALEQGYARVGETEVRPLQCKVIAATNKGEADLAVDVFMRFGMIIRTAPLRTRPSDIAQIVNNHVLDRARDPDDADNAKAFVNYDASGRAYAAVHRSLIVNLLRHPLPGNVRQVRTIVNTAIREAKGVAPLRWPARIPEPAAATLVPRKDEVPREVSIRELEEGLDKRTREEAERRAARAEAASVSGQRPWPSKEFLLEALDRNRWHYRNTAKALGITEHQLYRLRQKFELA